MKKNYLKYIKNFSKIFVLASCCIITLLFVSCTNKGKGTGAQRDNIKIGFSIDTFIIERWQKDCNTFKETARSYGAEVIVKNAANSERVQINQIEELIEENVDVLVIVPKNATSLSEVLQKAKNKNIPVISYDRLIRNADVAMYFSIDSQMIGTLMTQALIEDVTVGGIYCILGSEDDYNMTLVDKGIRDALSGTSVSVDVKYFTPDWNYDLAYVKMSSLLDQNLIPQGVICGNDAVAESVIRAIAEHKIDKNIPVVGQDCDISACRRIIQGTQKASIYKPIEELAKKAAESACLLAMGQKVSDILDINQTIDNGFCRVPVYWITPVLVNVDNMDQVVIESNFHKKSEIYR